MFKVVLVFGALVASGYCQLYTCPNPQSEIENWRNFSTRNCSGDFIVCPSNEAVSLAIGENAYAECRTRMTFAAAAFCFQNKTCERLDPFICEYKSEVNLYIKGSADMMSLLFLIEEASTVNNATQIVCISQINGVHVMDILNTSTRVLVFYLDLENTTESSTTTAINIPTTITINSETTTTKVFPTTISTTGDPTSTGSTTNSPTSGTTTPPTNGTTTNGTTTIADAVPLENIIIPVAVAVVVGLVIFFLVVIPVISHCYRRKKKKKGDAKRSSTTIANNTSKDPSSCRTENIPLENVENQKRNGST